jgi:hypothetical protein
MKTKIVKASPKRLLVRMSLPLEEEMYDKDFFKWTKTQANLLKKHDLRRLDIDHLREEIESLGRSDKRSLKSHLIILLQHLLKKKFHPQGKGNSGSWDASINNALTDIRLILEDSPSLKRELISMCGSAYDFAREKAAFDTHLDKMHFPKECPWEIQDILPFIKKKKT